MEKESDASSNSDKNLRRLLIAGAFVHLVSTAFVYLVGRFGILPRMIQSNGVMIEDSSRYFDKTLLLTQYLYDGQFAQWLFSDVQVHIRIYSLSTFFLSPIVGKNIFSILIINLPVYLLLLFFIYKIGEVCFNKQTGMIGALIAGLFPSLLLHLTQPLRDPFFIVLFLALIYIAIEILAKEINARHALVFCYAGVLTFILIWFIRDGFLPVYFGIVFLTILILSWASLRQKSFSVSKFACLFLFLIVLFVIPKMFRSLLPPKRESTSEQIQAIEKLRKQRPEEREQTGVFNKINDMREAASIAHSDAGSNIDADRTFNSITDVILYLPKATVIGLFSPFPSTWLKEGKLFGRTGRIIVGFETTFTYLLYLFAALAIWQTRDSYKTWLLSLIYLMGAIALGLVFINIGTLYRMRYCFWILLAIVASQGIWFVYNKAKKKTLTPENHEEITTHPSIIERVKTSIERVWLRLSVGTVNRRIFRATVIVGAITILAKFLIVARDLIVAWKLGRSPALDAYLIAFIIPYTISTAFSTSLTATFLPHFIELHAHGKEREAQSLYAGVMAWLLVVLGAIMFLIIVTQRFYAPVVASGFSKENWDLMFRLLLLTAPAALFGCVVVFLQAILNAEEDFLTSSLVTIIAPVVSILLLLWFGVERSVYALSSGLLLGAVLEMFVLCRALKRRGFSLLPYWQGLSVSMREVIRQWLRVLISNSLINTMSLTDNAMVARRAAAGSVSALSYGRKAVTLPIEIAATAFVTATAPYFSKTIAIREWTTLRKTLDRYLLLVFITTLPVVFILIIWSKPIIKLLFERGAFTAEDTDVVAVILSYYAFQLPFYVAFLMLMKLLSALRKNIAAIWFGSLGLILNISLNYIFIRRIGVAGIALSTSVVYFILFLSLYLYLKTLLKRKFAE